MQAKLAIKRVGFSLAAAIGPCLSNQRLRQVLCDRVVPLVLDDAVCERRPVPRKQRRSKVSVLCDPHDSAQRASFFCGVARDEELESFLLRELHPGDSLIDVGMRGGHVALPAAKLVAPVGKVVAFERRTSLVQGVRALASEQGLDTLRVHACALDDTEGELFVASEINPRRRCTVRVGDEVLRKQALPGRVGLKIDAEAFELSVLRGLRETLRDRVDYALFELVPYQLGVPGLQALFSLLEDMGFEARALERDGTCERRIGPLEVLGPMHVAFWRMGPRGQVQRFRPVTYRPIVAS
ncbi:MAG: FkbM family methyltransferase [Myxococcales bacterium]